MVSPPSVNPSPRASRSSILASTSTASATNSHNPSSSSPPASSPPPTTNSISSGRARSSSIQKSASAVLRALARAPEDESNSEAESTNGNGILNRSKPEKTSNIRDEIDQVYSNGADADIEGPDKKNFLHSQTNGNPVGIGLTEEEKLNGRSVREGMRSRKDVKQVEKLVGNGDEKKKKVAKGWKKSKSWEIPRKLFHSSIGFLVLYMYTNDIDLHKIVRGLSIFLGIVITADVIRLNYKPFEKVYESVLGILMREAEKTQVNGVVWYLIGVISALHFFPEDIASLSVMILSWCDTSASVFGRMLGAYTPPLPSPPFARRKSLAGFLAAFISGTLTAYYFWGTGVANRGARIGGLSWDLNHISSTTSTSTSSFLSSLAGVNGAIFGSNSIGTGWRGFRIGFRSLPSFLPYPTSSSFSSASASQHLSAGEYLSQTKDVVSGVYEGLAGNRVPQIPLVLLCLGSGLVAAVAESLELGGIDDNLSLPILGSAGIWGMLWCWGRVASWWVS